MKVKKTKEEKQEIKQYKKEERKMALKRGKNNFRIEYLYLAGAVLILLLLLFILIYMLFFSKGKNAIVPDKPTYENVDIGVVDFDDQAANAFDLNTKKNSNINVNYEIISDYYKNGITLSNTLVEYLNNSFTVTSGPLSKTSFISTISKDGKMSWLTKLDDKEFGSVKVYKTIYTKDSYYIGAVVEKNNKKSLAMIEVDSSGKRITTRIIKKDFSGKIEDILLADNSRIAIIANEDKNINVYFTDADLKENKNIIEVNKQFDSANYINYQTSSSVNNIVNLICANDNKYYNLEINVNNYEVNRTELDAINNLETEDTVKVDGYLKGFIAYTNNTLYKLDPNHRLINKYDYSSIKLENEDAYKEKYKDDEFINIEDMENSIYIENISSDDTKIIVNTKTMFSSIYDIYDLNLNINKRIILDSFKYSYDEGVILKSFYIDGVIYEVYSYGTETPSIMISKIG